MEYDRVIKLLGMKDEHPSVLAVKLAASEPDCGKFVLDALKATAGSFRKNGDVRETAWQDRSDPGSVFYSQVVMRNLFRLMFETDAFDEAVLAPGFRARVDALISEVKRKSGAKKDMFGRRVWDQSMLELSENLMELRDRLREKAAARGGK